jgi:DNA-binding beta-propeller fold protein YncE
MHPAFRILFNPCPALGPSDRLRDFRPRRFRGIAPPAGRSCSREHLLVDGSSPDGTIRVGSVDGSLPVKTLFMNEDDPHGVAIDPAAGKIYWADYNSNLIRVGNLDGAGSAANLFTGEASPAGVALDPPAAKIYWVNHGSLRMPPTGRSGGGLRRLDRRSGPRHLEREFADIGACYVMLAGQRGSVDRHLAPNRATVVVAVDAPAVR